MTDKSKAEVAAQVPAAPEPAWLLYARKEIGVEELPGADTNRRITEYWDMSGLNRLLRVDGDETPWCAVFASAMLAKSGYRGAKHPLARSFESWGSSLKEPQPGCITVLARPHGESWQGHVGFWVGADPDHVHLLGGNQGDAVDIAKFPLSRVVAYRWPSDAEKMAAVVDDDAPKETGAVAEATAPEISDPNDR